jgi:hypothetical protein
MVVLEVSRCNIYGPADLRGRAQRPRAPERVHERWERRLPHPPHHEGDGARACPCHGMGALVCPRAIRCAIASTVCRGTWAHATIDQSRHLALETG